jgi:hypothetical protein
MDSTKESIMTTTYSKPHVDERRPGHLVVHGGRSTGDGRTAMNTTTDLPAPSSAHATCAWCRKGFDSITELIDHVDAGHMTTAPGRAAA